MTVAEIVQRFDGEIVAVEASKPTGLAIDAAEGELWVAKDLTVEPHPRADWIDGRPIYAQDWTSYDNGRSRAFRRLDRDWYVWLYHATQRARPLNESQPQVWQELARRFNSLWEVACRWWGAEQVAWIHREHHLDARYRPPSVNPR